MDEKEKKNSWDGGQNIQESGIYDASYPYSVRFCIIHFS